MFIIYLRLLICEPTWGLQRYFGNPGMLLLDVQLEEGKQNAARCEYAAAVPPDGTEVRLAHERAWQHGCHSCLDY